jgi:hypothetical protein
MSYENTERAFNLRRFDLMCKKMLREFKKVEEPPYTPRNTISTGATDNTTNAKPHTNPSPLEHEPPETIATASPDFEDPLLTLLAAILFAPDQDGEATVDYDDVLSLLFTLEE